MRKQEIKRAIDLIAHFYATALWYNAQTDIQNREEKARREEYGAEGIEWLLHDTGVRVVVHRDEGGREYAVETRIAEDEIYIRWVAAAVHPWDNISFELFKEEVEELKELFRVFTTDGTIKGMKEL